jgi:hypothetical protein
MKGKGEMPQDRESGASAVKYGLETARQIAAILGGRKVGYHRSNEYQIEERVVVIKCAKSTTNSVGVSYQMLGRVGTILGAFEVEDGSYNIYEMTPDAFQSHMRPTRSTGPSVGRVGIVRKSAFLEHGAFLRKVIVQ